MESRFKFPSLAQLPRYSQKAYIYSACQIRGAITPQGQLIHFLSSPASTDKAPKQINWKIWDTKKTHTLFLSLTFLTSRHIATPSEVPLAHDDLRAHQLVPRVALVGDDGAVDEVGVRCALPAVGDLRQLGAGVVSRHLWWRLGETRVRPGDRTIGDNLLVLIL